jgi:hypothetical protein
MFTKTAVALAIVIGAASGALAATEPPNIAPNHDARDACGKYGGSDLDCAPTFPPAPPLCSITTCWPRCSES